MKATEQQVAAVRALLRAREELVAAQAAVFQAQTIFNLAEDQFIDSRTSTVEVQANVCLDGHVIMLKDEHYDLPRGSRVEFHSVETLKQGDWERARRADAYPRLVSAIQAARSEGRSANQDGDVVVPSHVWDLWQSVLGELGEVTK